MRIASLVEVCRPLARVLRRSYAAFRTALLGSSPRWRPVAGKFYMRIDPKDWADREFYLGTYEPRLVELIAAVVEPGDVCIDIGAQKGFMTLHMAKAVGPYGWLIAFEPDPRAVEILRSNVNRNGLEQVTVHASALGDSETSCEFALSQQLGWSSRFPNELAKSVVASTIQVQTRRLDHVLAEMDILPETHRLSFIKIDAEGSEPLVLRGAQRTLENFHPVLHIEVNQGSLRAGGFSPQLLEEFLRSLDYGLYAVRYRRAGFLLRRRLWLSPVPSLAGLGSCEDILAIHASAPSRIRRLARN